MKKPRRSRSWLGSVSKCFLKKHAKVTAAVAMRQAGTVTKKGPRVASRGSHADAGEPERPYAVAQGALAPFIAARLAAMISLMGRNRGGHVHVGQKARFVEPPGTARRWRGTSGSQLPRAYRPLRPRWNKASCVSSKSSARIRTEPRISYSIGMNSPVELRRRAEACRRLADMAETEETRMAWLTRANEWERLATRAEKKLPQKPGPTAAGPENKKPRRLSGAKFG
jgi:hypothetical protein